MGEKISLSVSVLSFLLAFIGLALGDSVSNLSKSAVIVAVTDSIKLSPLTNSNGYLSTLNLENRGNAASKNIKLIIEFSTKIPKYHLLTDEDIGKVEAEGRKLRIPLDRLSSDSNLKVTMFAESLISYEAHYIDDSGKNQIRMYNETVQSSLLDVFLLLVIIVSLLAIVWIYKRISESALIDTLESHQNDIQKRLREFRDEIGNIEVVVNEPSNVDGAGVDDKGLRQRLADFITKN